MVATRGSTIICFLACNFKGGSRILKWEGVNFCNKVREIIISIFERYEKKERLRGHRKRGWKFTHFTSPRSAPELFKTPSLHHVIFIVRCFLLFVCLFVLFIIYVHQNRFGQANGLYIGHFREVPWSNRSLGNVTKMLGRVPRRIH